MNLSETSASVWNKWTLEWNHFYHGAKIWTISVEVYKMKLHTKYQRPGLLVLYNNICFKLFSLYESM